MYDEYQVWERAGTLLLRLPVTAELTEFRQSFAELVRVEVCEFDNREAGRGCLNILEAVKKVEQS